VFSIQSETRYWHNKQQLKIQSERLSAVHKEVQSLRHEMSDRLKSMRSEVVDLLNDQSNELKSLFKQHKDLVERSINISFNSCQPSPRLLRYSYSHIGSLLKLSRVLHFLHGTLHSQHPRSEAMVLRQFDSAMDMLF